jgi:fermentation-respiration switch protein FrsA (DUF1100 family)
MSTTAPGYGQVDREYGMRLATTPAEQDGPVWMVNLMKYRAVADYTDGRESTISGREADDLYTPLGPLAAVGAEIAFRSGTPLRALVLLSPTIVDEASWLPGMAARRGLPVLLAHGRLDHVLAFRSSERLATLMREAGLRVTWVPFEGGHDMPPTVVTDITRFLDDVDRPR